MRLAEELRQAVLQSAIRGNLSNQTLMDTPVEETFQDIEKYEVDGSELFSIPNNWKYVAIKNFTDGIEAGKSPDCIKTPVTGDEWGVITTTAIQWGDFDSSQNKKLPGGFEIQDKWIVRNNDILITRAGPMTRTGVACVAYTVDKNLILSDKTLRIRTKYINRDYFVLCFRVFDIRKQIVNIMNGMDKQQVNISQKNILNVIVPFPPIEEQQRIVDRVNELMKQIDEYAKIEQQLISLKDSFPGDLRSAILYAAIQGKLTEQNPSDTSPLESIQKARDTLVETLDGQRVKKKNIKNITETEYPFELPDKWEWVRLGDICIIARGGSPRPISNYITDASDGVNWIKIGDTEKNGKYIYSTAEKIKPEGVSKSRFVHEGDFLLTNSMSFGRPYILKTEGCIHDGWLVISQPVSVFLQDYLYYMLSSQFAYYQFAEAASGGVVKNLNSDKVANAIFPVPPIEEQQRIVNRLDNLLPLCDTALEE